MGNITLARDEVGYGTQVYELLMNAETASQKMRMVIRQLSSLAGGHVLSLQAADIAALVRETADKILYGSSVRCRYDFPGDLWSVACDEEQMRHVMRILISNAREAMPESGFIEFFGENLAVEWEGQAAGLPFRVGRYVRVSVRDHGVGISEENIPRIFDPYFSTKERGIQKGMGFGLASVDAIIRKHHGHITVESRLNEGTTFHIYLPAEQEKESEG
jgi:two-component system cell cycle sensor histidine kinase/response regulator CckA